MRKVLITGAAGFIGEFLAKECSEAGFSVLGLGVTEPAAGWTGAGFERCDIRDSVRLSELISAFRPDRVFHLAAQSYPTVSLDRPRETMDVNAGGTINLFECLRAAEIRPVVVVACSSAEYGFVAADDLPVREDHPLRPLHPYGVSKVAQDLLTAQYCATYAIPAVRIRIFNTTGPGKLGDVCSDLTKRAVELELALRQPSLRVGNLTSRRAIIDVRDMVRALCLAAERCQYGEVYNVGATRTYSVEELIDAIRARVNVPFRTQQDQALMRGRDEAVIIGDITRFQHCTGWSPEIDLARTLQDMLDWWRRRLCSCPPDPDCGKGLPASSGATSVDSTIGAE
jgi:GDP-4-dehydro-6-deoxy-D-mannose reductase